MEKRDGSDLLRFMSLCCVCVCGRVCVWGGCLYWSVEIPDGGSQTISAFDCTWTNLITQRQPRSHSETHNKHLKVNVLVVQTKTKVPRLNINLKREYLRWFYDLFSL